MPHVCTNEKVGLLRKHTDPFACAAPFPFGD